MVLVIPLLIKKAAIGTFDIGFIEAERTSESVSRETKREIKAFSKDQDSIQAIRELRQKLSGDLKEILKPALDRMSDLFSNQFCLFYPLLNCRM